MKNDPLYQAVENIIPKPPKKKQAGGGNNFLQDIENMLNGTCGKPGSVPVGKTYQPVGPGINNNSTAAQMKKTSNEDSTSTEEPINIYNSNSTPGVIKTTASNLDTVKNIIANTMITEQNVKTGEVTSTIICPKPANTGKESNTNNGGRGKKYIANQRLSEKPFSDFL